MYWLSADDGMALRTRPLCPRERRSLLAAPSGSPPERGRRCSPFPDTLVSTAGPLALGCRPPFSPRRVRILTGEPPCPHPYRAHSSRPWLVALACEDRHALDRRPPRSRVRDHALSRHGDLARACRPLRSREKVAWLSREDPSGEQRRSMSSIFKCEDARVAIADASFRGKGRPRVPFDMPGDRDGVGEAGGVRVCFARGLAPTSSSKARAMRPRRSWLSRSSRSVCIWPT
jgi:hypothetical protein